MKIIIIQRDSYTELRKALRIMKITIILLFTVTYCWATNTSYAQNAEVKVTAGNKTLMTLFSEIENNSEFLFFYKDDVIDLNRTVTLSEATGTISEILDEVLEGTHTRYKIIDRQVVLYKVVGTEKKQEITQVAKKQISGNVTDSSGESIIGANILEKGTTNGTITDIDGNFTLTVEENAILQVSYIGYTIQEVSVQKKLRLTIILSEDAQGLEEVIVVGFGVQKKVNLTGSVGIASAKDLENRPVQNVAQALQGLVPGLLISTSGGGFDNKNSISIRGTATIGEGSDGAPLILIDGMEGDINSLNPQDIENISVLKDAAASSIYGSRAPFGVILITTKGGKESKVTVNYNNNFRWNSPVIRPKMMDSYTFATYFNDASTNAGWAPHFSEEHLQRILDFQSGKITTTNIPNPSNPQYWADGYGYANDNIDWYKALYNDWSFAHEHNFSVNGGNEKMNYYVSGALLDYKGLMKINTDTFERYSITGKINATLTSWAKLNYSTRFTREDYNWPTTMNASLYDDLGRQGWPTLPLRDPNGYYFSSPSPALGLAEGGNTKSQTDNLYQQITLILEPIKNWKTNINFNYRTLTYNRHVDLKQQLNHDVNENSYVFRTNSYVQEENRKDNYLNLNIFSEYSHSLESGHSMKIMGGFQAEDMDKGNFSALRNGIILNELPVIDLTSGMDYNGNPVTPTLSGGNYSWATAGFFGRLNYDYKGKYLVEINMRYDGTSRFQKDKRWKLFPSFSIGWNLAHESFWESIQKTVGTFKLRASYGELGNQNTVGWYPTYRVMKVGSGNGTWLQNGIKPNTANIPELISPTMGWERVRNWNMGLDLGMFNNRLTGTFDYYIRETLDMIGPAPELPVVLGMKVPITNNTDLRTYGFDLILSWSDRLKNGLGYSAKFIMSDSQTKITRYPNETGTLTMHRSGKMLNEIWGYETVGIAKSHQEMDAHLASLPKGGQNALGSQWEAGDIMYKDLNNDGKIDNGANTIADHGDLKIIGNSTPRYQFGLDLNSDWKGFDFRLFLQGVMKRDIWQGSYYFWGATNSKWVSTGFVEHEDYFRAESSNHLPANLNAYYPRPLFSTNKNQSIQSRYLQDASYIRLKNIQLGYAIPSAITNKFNVSKLRFFVSGENLWTGTKMKGMFDPETVTGGGSWAQGSSYPLSKTISFGLSITL